MNSINDATFKAVPKLPANQIDAAPEAAGFLESKRCDGVYRLRFWRGTFWWWRDGAYREVNTQEVRSRLVDFLDCRFAKLTRAAITNVLECVKAKSCLPEHIEPPAWLVDDLWPAGEVLATSNWLIHLSKFVGGPPDGSDYRRPATPRFFNTSALRFAFDPDAPVSELWLKTLQEWFAEDRETIDTLQEWFGYCLTSDTRQQKILLIVGPKRSGKGTIARVLRQLVGPENVAGPTLASLGTNFGLWPLLGKSLAVINDARLGRHSNSAAMLERLLTISGEDSITVDRKCLPPVTCKLSARLMILTNELPRITDSSGALASRMIVVPMQRSFYGREDETLTDKLLDELPGILLWAIEGWGRLQSRTRFVQPKTGRQLFDELEELASPVTAFVREHCVVEPGYRVSVDSLFERWKRWCRESARREVGTRQMFGRDLHAAFPAVQATRLREGDRRPTGYEGIGLLTDA